MRSDSRIIFWSSANMEWLDTYHVHIRLFTELKQSPQAIFHNGGCGRSPVPSFIIGVADTHVAGEIVFIFGALLQHSTSMMFLNITSKVMV